MIHDGPIQRQGWAGVVLAGGRSVRMGRDKAMIEVDGRPLVAHAVELLRPHVEELLIIGEPSRYASIAPLVLADDTPGLGPLGGILTALRYTWNDHLLVLACDMPNVNAVLIERLKAASDADHDAVVPQCDGRLEPLAAIYHRRCRKSFEQCVAEGDLKMAHAIERVRALYLQVCPGEDSWPPDLFRNINTPADL